jgi:hypothetical protein
MTRPALNGGKECPDLIQLGRGKFDIAKLNTQKAKKTLNVFEQVYHEKPMTA